MTRQHPLSSPPVARTPAAAYICGRRTQCASRCRQTSGTPVRRLAAVSSESRDHQPSRLVLSSLRDAMMILWNGRSDCHADGISICVTASQALELLTGVRSEHGLRHRTGACGANSACLSRDRARSWQRVSVTTRNHPRFFSHGRTKTNIRSTRNGAGLSAQCWHKRRCTLRISTVHRTCPS